MVNIIYLGRGLSDEMMVFSGIDSELLDKFLSEYKKNGIEPINYKAVLTVNNIFWTPEELYFPLDGTETGKHGTAESAIRC